LMTRSGNEDVPLYDRPDTAIKENVDMSVSIHNNALPDGINPFENNGTSAYYYFPQSRALAEKIHQRMVAATKLPDHGLYYGNLALTRIENFPAVLVECAFMMVPEQEAKLKTPEFRQTVAKAIADGITDFIR
jgi:N-acetylmuramoyl-L-alanine amidase